MHRLFFPIAVACALAGCGNDNARVYPVSGTVTVKGKPMSLGGSIALVPIDGQVGPAAGGTIAADGSFVLSTYEEGDGALPGKHRVVITQVTEQEPGMDQMPEDGAATARVKIAPAVPRSEWIPEKYADFRESPLTATVEPKENVLELDLTWE